MTSSFILAGYEALQVLAFHRCAWEVPFEKQLLDITGPGSSQDLTLSSVNVKSFGPGLLVLSYFRG